MPEPFYAISCHLSMQIESINKRFANSTFKSKIIDEKSKWARFFHFCLNFRFCRGLWLPLSLTFRSFSFCLHFSFVFLLENRRAGANLMVNFVVFEVRLVIQKDEMRTEIEWLPDKLIAYIINKIDYLFSSWTVLWITMKNSPVITLWRS